jgi:uncharacterized membrane protein YsdA (DUF1294 family)
MKRQPLRRQKRAPTFAVPLAALFLLCIAGASVVHKLPLKLLALYVGASLITFAAYAIDKAAARRNRQRIAEKTLHLLSIVGGWPGALLAQELVRHKSVKPEFRRVFWGTVLINCAVLVLFVTPLGAQLFRALAAER